MKFNIKRLSKGVDVKRYIFGWRAVIYPLNVGYNENIENLWSKWKTLNLSLYPLHILHTVSVHFLRCWQGEFVEQSRASLVGCHLLYSCGFNVWFRGDIVQRNYRC